MSSPNSPEVPAATGNAPIAAPQSGSEPAADALVPTPAEPASVPEIGGRRDGTDPTRFGDWEKGGRCIDF